MDTTLRNHTPHDIVLVLESGIARISPTFPATRCIVKRQPEQQLSTDRGLVPFGVSWTGAPIDVPDATPGVVLIVSRIVAESQPDRHDLAFPDLLVRDRSGQVVGCKRLSWPSHHPAARPSRHPAASTP